MDIVKIKMKDLNAHSEEAAFRTMPERHARWE